MKITFIDDEYVFSREFEERPNAYEAVFSTIYLLCRVYCSEKVLKAVQDVLEDY
jgi:hypothetical protein